MPVLHSVKSAIARAVRRAIGYVTDTIYGAAGFEPSLTADFTEEFYRGPGVSNFTDLITHARAGNATMTDGYGPELVTNGGFTNDISGWTAEADSDVSYDDGKIRLTVANSVNRGAYQAITTEAGKTYVVDALLAEASAGNATVRVGTVAGGGDLFSDQLSAGAIQISFTATSSTSYIVLRPNSTVNGTTVVFDNVSVREMPVIKWAPHNLLTYSEDFSDADWIKTNTATLALDATGPDGQANSAVTLVDDSGTGTGVVYVGKTVTVSTSTTYTFSVFAKADQVNSIMLYPASFTTPANNGWIFNLDDGSVTEYLSSPASTYEIEEVGNGWYLCSITFTTDSADSVGTLRIYPSDGTNISVDRDGTSSVLIYGAHLYRSDLGGMADNPDQPLSRASYVPTALRPFGANLVTNGTFDSDSDWTKGAGWTISGGTASHAAGTASNLEQALTFETGVTYSIAFTISGATAGTVRPEFRGGSTVTGTSVGNNGDYVQSITAVSGNNNFIFSAGSSFDGSIDNIVVRKSSINPSSERYLPRVGHHVYNGSAWVNEGVLAESESRVNQVLNTVPKSTNWAKARTTFTEDDAVSPSGLEDAARINEDATTNSHYVYTYGTSITSGNTYTFSVYVKADTATAVQLTISTSVFSNQNYANFDLTSGTVGTTGTDNVAQTIENAGNGWYRISLTSTATATNASATGLVLSLTDNSTSANRLPSYAGDTAQQFYIYGAQTEVGSTPSSLIPTSGSSVTRAAETFTIPSANLPWPTPQYIGSELVTNGTFDSATTGWTAGDSASILSVLDGELNIENGDASPAYAAQTLSQEVGKVYAVTFTVTAPVGEYARLLFAGYDSGAAWSSGTYTVFVVAQNSAALILANSSVSGLGESVQWDNISVREISPMSVSIGMEGRITYADENSTSQAIFWQWRDDVNNRLLQVLRTNLGTGELQTNNIQSGTADEVRSDSSRYSPDVLVPFDIASRHGSTFVNAGTEGVALTANTTPTALPDLSSTDLDLAYDYMGTISEFRVWDKDIGDAGLVEATEPSLEPSLSLTFEGVGTNSFVVNDWSQ